MKLPYLLLFIFTLNLSNADEVAQENELREAIQSQCRDMSAIELMEDSEQKNLVPYIEIVDDEGNQGLINCSEVADLPTIPINQAQELDLDSRPRQCYSQQDFFSVASLLLIDTNNINNIAAISKCNAKTPPTLSCLGHAFACIADEGIINDILPLKKIEGEKCPTSETAIASGKAFLKGIKQGVIDLLKSPFDMIQLGGDLISYAGNKIKGTVSSWFSNKKDPAEVFHQHPAVIAGEDKTTEQAIAASTGGIRSWLNKIVPTLIQMADSSASSFYGCSLKGKDGKCLVPLYSLACANCNEQFPVVTGILTTIISELGLSTVITVAAAGGIITELAPRIKQAMALSKTSTQVKKGTEVISPIGKLLASGAKLSGSGIQRIYRGTKSILKVPTSLVVGAVKKVSLVGNKLLAGEKRLDSALSRSHVALAAAYKTATLPLRVVLGLEDKMLDPVLRHLGNRWETVSRNVSLVAPVGKSAEVYGQALKAGINLDKYSSRQRVAIEAAHNANPTAQKARILKKGGLSKSERKLLLNSGVAGKNLINRLDVAGSFDRIQTKIDFLKGEVNTRFKLLGDQYQSDPRVIGQRQRTREMIEAFEKKLKSERDLYLVASDEYGPPLIANAEDQLSEAFDLAQKNLRSLEEVGGFIQNRGRDGLTYFDSTLKGHYDHGSIPMSHFDNSEEPFTFVHSELGTVLFDPALQKARIPSEQNYSRTITLVKRDGTKVDTTVKHKTENDVDTIHKKRLDVGIIAYPGTPLARKISQNTLRSRPYDGRLISKLMPRQFAANIILRRINANNVAPELKTKYLEILEANNLAPDQLSALSRRMAANDRGIIKDSENIDRVINQIAREFNEDVTRSGAMDLMRSQREVGEFPSLEGIHETGMVAGYPTRDIPEHISYEILRDFYTKHYADDGRRTIDPANSFRRVNYVERNTSVMNLERTTLQRRAREIQDAPTPTMASRIVEDTKVQSALTEIGDFDVVIPAPSSQTGVRASDLLAAAVATNKTKPLATQAFIRDYPVRQTDLDIDQIHRFRNVTNHVLADGDELKGKTILIVDDLVDSGATLDNLIALAYEHGAKKVKVLSILRSGRTIK